MHSQEDVICQFFCSAQSMAIDKLIAARVRSAGSVCCAALWAAAARIRPIPQQLLTGVNGAAAAERRRLSRLPRDARCRWPLPGRRCVAAALQLALSYPHCS